MVVKSSLKKVMAITDRINGRKMKSLKLLLLLSPFLAFVIIFSYVPLFGWSYAFVKFNPALSISEMTFVGLDNFRALFRFTGALRTVMTNTLAISALALLSTVLPVILAIMISQVRSRKYSKFIQSATTIPHFISWVLVYSIVFSLFAPESGAVNQFLMGAGIISKPIDLLGNVEGAWFVQTGIGLWKGLGWGTIIYLAAIAGIDQELYEAAAVDGCGRFGRMWHITLPSIKPTIIILLILNTGWILNASFEVPYILGNSGLVREVSETIDIFVLRRGFGSNSVRGFSYGTAAGMFKTVVSVILLTLMNKIAGWVGEEKLV
jgi:putative aldouronate transport system permease protein